MGCYFLPYIPATGRIHAIITNPVREAVKNSLSAEITEINNAEKNCPANMALVQKLIFSPLFEGVLLFTIRLLYKGVEKPKPIPVNTAAVHKRKDFPEKKY